MIVVIGVSGGIGRYLAEEYSKRGQKVVGTFFSKRPTLSEPIYLLEKLDASNFNDVMTFVDAIPIEDERITLINCHGINYNKVGHKADSDDWAHVVETNLVGVFNTIRGFLPRMRDAGYGRVINFGSVVPQIGVPGTSAYSASKAGLWGLAKSLAAENAVKGISVNNINLGYFDVGMISDVPEEVLAAIKRKIPAGRLGSAAEIFEVVEMLRHVEYINGASIDVNGGL